MSDAPAELISLRQRLHQIPERAGSEARTADEVLRFLRGCPPDELVAALDEAAQVTVVHARLGTASFGTSPGEGVVLATLRAHAAAVLERLKAHVLDFPDALIPGAVALLERTVARLQATAAA